MYICICHIKYFNILYEFIISQQYAKEKKFSSWQSYTKKEKPLYMSGSFDGFGAFLGYLVEVADIFFMRIILWS